MKTYKCEIGQSLYDYLANKDTFKEGLCYNNSFILLSEYLSDTSVRGVIGYVLSSDGKRKVAVRHCWLKRKNPYSNRSEIIDVTMFANQYEPFEIMNFDYLEVKVLEPAVWLRLTERNNGCPAITGIRKEKDIVQGLKLEGYEVLE